MALGRRERATLAAFAEALIPEEGRLPGAVPAGIDVVGPVCSMLGAAPSRVRLGARVALWVLELGEPPRLFSRQPIEARRARIVWIEGGPAGLRRELLLLLKSLTSVAYARAPVVQEALGMRAACVLADDRPGAPSRGLDRSSLAAPGGVEHCDVVVVGSGAGGAAAARVLAESGLRTIVVEEGDYHDASSYPSDPIAALETLYRDGGLTACEGRPAIPLPLGRCVGGTTVVNSGTCFRTPADVLTRWRDEWGIPWATDLDHEFEALERDLLIEPVDPATAGRNAALCRAGAEAIGASNGPISRNAGSVVCCGTCPTGCRLDAKQATHVSELPRAVAAGCLVRAGARAEHVLVERASARGVVCRTRGGGRYEVRARAVVMAAGAIGTPRLLLSQKLADPSGQLGRNLRIHPACWVGGVFDEPVNGWEGVMQSWYVDEWRERGLFLEATFTPFAFGAHWLPGAGPAFKERLERYGRLAVIGVHMSDHSSGGRVRPGTIGPGVTYRLGREDAEAIHFGIARAADILFAAGAREVYPQVAGIPAIKSSAQTPAFEDARLGGEDLRLEAFHPMGTARMGSQGGRSVVAPTGETHGVASLYVADASIFPTSLGVNPMITIMACSRRIAAGLADRLS